jgi:hypothetical protein
MERLKGQHMRGMIIARIALLSTLTFAGFTAAGEAAVAWTTGNQIQVAIGSTPHKLSPGRSASVPIPSTELTGQAISKSKRQAKFKFKPIGKASGFQCALVKQAKKGRKAPEPRFALCTSPKKYKHLAHGSYKFEVRARSAGGADPTPAAASFKI